MRSLGSISLLRERMTIMHGIWKLMAIFLSSQHGRVPEGKRLLLYEERGYGTTCYPLRYHFFYGGWSGIAFPLMTDWCAWEFICPQNAVVVLHTIRLSRWNTSYLKGSGLGSARPGLWIPSNLGRLQHEDGNNGWNLFLWKGVKKAMCKSYKDSCVL